jgi:hypothetical protein
MGFMSNRSTRFAAIGVAAMSVGAIVLSAPPTASAASQTQAPLFAQADGTKGKSDNDKGRRGEQAPRDLSPGRQDPGNQAPGNQAPIPPSPVLQNAPQTGVPARCASVVDATERQKCMNTPKGE